MSKGIDYGFGRPNIQTIVNNGYTFVCRYLSHNPEKSISKEELTELKNAGLDIVLVWETTTGRPLEGYQAGIDDANSAVQQISDIGAPDDCVVYFACDDAFNVVQQSTINKYFQGIATVLDLSCIGVYGGYGVVTRCFNAGVVSFGWQTYAWSHGQWEPRAQLRQTNIYGPTLNGVSCDTNESVKDDFGQF